MENEIHPIHAGHPMGASQDPLEFAKQVRLWYKWCEAKCKGSHQSQSPVKEGIHVYWLASMTCLS